MIILEKKNPWGCLETAFAMVMEMPLDQIYTLIGHDGSEIVNDLPEPSCRRGFHIQELITAAILSGFTVTEIEAFPVLWTADEKEIEVYPDEDAVDRFKFYLQYSEGVVFGRKIGARFNHVYVCSYGDFYDPDTGEQVVLPETFQAVAFYKVDNILWQNGQNE